MPIYVYETIPQKPRQKARRFELKQSIKDAALKKHPETGEPVRRVITGGAGVITSKARSSSKKCCGRHGSKCCGGGGCCSC
ncbi:MAG: zinc ribbon domain-containing protein [Opitutae bacterium]|nr:zinc ribbon domain-containing protein [Opitutae bacterium]